MRSFEHAAASREQTDAVVLRLVLADGREGWGETHPRRYVTGETIGSVTEDLAAIHWPALLSAWADAADIEAIAAALPARAAEGRCVTAAACALELALRSAMAPPAIQGRKITPRVSGVIGSSDPDRTAKKLRLMRWFGLRDFKLKLGFGDDVDCRNLKTVHQRIGRAVQRGKCTLRVDVNGAWSAAETPARLADLKPMGVCVVEQPVFCAAAELADLARRCELPLMADESLLTADDAESLLGAGGRVWWNVRLSKNGGFGPSLSLLRRAEREGIPFVVGCMVGESGVLSWWERRLLQSGPVPRFVEGNYGRFLLREDLTRPSPRFGYAGRLRAMSRPPRVLPERLARYGHRLARLEA